MSGLGLEKTLCRLICHAWGFSVFLRRERCVRCKAERA